MQPALHICKALCLTCNVPSLMRALLTQPAILVCIACVKRTYLRNINYIEMSLC